MKNDFERILIFLKVNPIRTWPCSYVFPFKWKIRDHVVLDKILFGNMERFVNSNCFREVLYVVKSSYQASPRPTKIIKKYKN